MSDDNNKYFDDTIVIDNIQSNNSEDVITIYFKNLHSQYLDKDNSYKVSPNGKILSNSLTSNLNENSKGILIKELISHGFEKIPDNFTELELESILKFSRTEMQKEISCAKIEPYSAQVADNGDLKITLLIYNGNSITLTLEKFPLKLKDANNKVVLADFIDLNMEISSKKIGICCLKIGKDILLEEKLDLNTWSITFEV